MKREIGFTFLTLMALSLSQMLSPRLEAQSSLWNDNNKPRDGVCFYTNANYRGEDFCVSGNESMQSVGDRYNDTISSIRIFGRAEVTVYQNSNFNGSRRTFSQDVPNLGNWSDRITSFQVTGGRQYEGQYGGQSRGQYGGQGSGNERREGACFYKDANYKGENFCVSGNESMQSVGDRYNDTISSIRIFGRAEVTAYQNSNFNGSRRTFSQDVPNLGNWSDRITSFQVTGGRQYEGQYGGQSRGQYGGQGSGNERREGVCFYKDANYKGENFCVSGNESMQSVGDRYNDTISSIRIFGRAEVTVYQNSNFNGSRRTFNQDVPNLGNWSDRITSFQVAGERQYEGQYGGQSRGQYGGQGSGNERREGACFYRDADFRGESFCLSAGESQRRVENRFHDAISSVQVFGRVRVVVHEHESFGGAIRTLTGDMPHLGYFNDKISSIEVR